jgi:hypothetical protein
MCQSRHMTEQSDGPAIRVLQFGDLDATAADKH